MYNNLCKYLISINKDLIIRTAIKDCHALGLNSFIINEKPKIRLFIADNNCELYDKFDVSNPIIPIHPHKYDDIFIQLKGKLIHHIYQLGNNIKFNKYKYLRISDNDEGIKKVGEEYLDYLGGYDNISELSSKQLHTASLEGDGCAWIIIETFQDYDFEQLSYHKDLKTRSDLYNKFDDPIGYLEEYFK